MRGRYLAIMGLCSILLQGCASNLPMAETTLKEAKDTPLSPIITPAILQTVSETLPSVPISTAISTLTPTSPPTATPSITTEQGPLFAQKCITPITKLPEAKTFSGKLFLSGPSKLNENWWLENTNSLFDLESYQIMAVTPRKIATIDVSPDHTNYVAVDAADHRIKVYSNNGQLLKTLPEGEFPYSIDGWLDNEHIALVVQEQETPRYLRYPREMVILNPFTNEKIDLSSRYPDIDVVMNITWEGGGTTKYDPQKKRVVYAAIIENDYLGRTGKGYILWDMEKQEKLVEVRTSEFLATPKWSPDGSKFVFNDSYGSGIFYIITRDGAVTQFPIFNPTSHNNSDNTSDRYNWSPDGKYLAFWQLDSQERMKATFAVLNTVTGEITDYCISAGYLEERVGEMSEAYLPVWSPDGKSVAVIANAQENGSFDTLLIDLENQFATKIEENMIPVGWLAITP